MGLVKKIEVRGYKKLTDFEINELAGVNYIVGRNASGKSSLFEVIKLIDQTLELQINQGTTVTGLTSYAFVSDFSAKITLENGGNIEVRIPQNTTITPEGNFGVSTGDPVWVNGQHLSPLSGNRNQVAKERTGIWFRGNYVSPFSETLESATNFIAAQNLPFNFVSIDDVGEEDIVKFLNKYYPLAEDEEISEVTRSIKSDSAILMSIGKKNTKERTGRVPLSQISGGLRAVLRFYFGITQQVRHFGVGPENALVLCIDEPENGLHPSYQKLIPIILNDFVKANPTLNFIVSTHSPFIISAASDIGGDSELQKTYLIADGKLVNLAGDSGSGKAEIGYTGKNCINVVATMLGAGFEDLGINPKTHEEMTVVYCEGSSQVLKDSDLYHLIFSHLSHYIFVSSGGCDEVISGLNISKSSVRFVFGEKSKAIGIIDRSCSSKSIQYGPNPGDKIPMTTKKRPMFSDKDRQLLIKSDTDNAIKVLLRKEIENYLFDPSVVSLLNKKLGSQVVISGKPDYVKGEVKDLVKAPDVVKIELAKIIARYRKSKTKKVYDELLSCLLG